MRREDARASAEQGTSLVELVIGATVVITLLLVISTSTAMQVRLRRLAEERNLAMVACRNLLESLRDVSLTTLPSLDGTGFDVPGANGKEGGLAARKGDDDGLPGHITVTVEASSGTARLYRVRLDVEWWGVSGDQSYDISSLFADRKS